MGVPTRNHIDEVSAVVEGQDVADADAEISKSWQRSGREHHVDPESREAPRILAEGELKGSREALSRLMHDAREELDRLYRIVKHARYTVLLCDENGVAVDHRGIEAQASEFKYWGTWLGGVWSEEIEGTNGIGTCIADQRPVTVHQGQHFRARHASLSCSGAPIFDPGGRLMAVLDVSSIDPGLSEQSHALTGPLTEASARAIQERAFRERFRGDWIVAVAPPEAAGFNFLFAVDRDQRIVGADRNARLMLDRMGLDTGVSLWAVFERQEALWQRKDDGDRPASLTPLGTGEPWPALITPPASVAERRPGSHLHARPRLDQVGRSQQLVRSGPVQGGLPPRTLQRVRDYIDSNLDKSISIEALAVIAGLSMFHFARAFKQSEGLTPHSYLLQRRIARAQHLLTSTDLTLASIALATGFSDQSHLARHFRERVGMPPGAFRLQRR